MFDVKYQTISLTRGDSATLTVELVKADDEPYELQEGDAHTHTPDVLKPARIRFNESNKVSIHDVITLTACSWVKAGGYSLQGLFEPQAVAQPQCLLLEFINSNDIRGRLRVVW